MEGCIWYLNNILLYSGNIEAEHQAIVEEVLQQYIEQELVGNQLKSQFHIHETIFLVHVINGQEVKMDHSKLETMCKWPIPTKRNEVQVFLAMPN